MEEDNINMFKLYNAYKNKLMTSDNIKIFGNCKRLNYKQFIIKYNDDPNIEIKIIECLKNRYVFYGTNILNDFIIFHFVITL